MLNMVDSPIFKSPDTFNNAIIILPPPELETRLIRIIDDWIVCIIETTFYEWYSMDIELQYF